MKNTDSYSDKCVKNFLMGIILASLIICMPDRTHLGLIVGILISRGKIWIENLFIIARYWMRYT